MGARRWTLAAIAVALAVWAALAASGARLGFSLGLGALLLALSWVDARERRLPDALTAALACLGAVMVAFLEPTRWIDHAVGGAAGYLSLLAVELGYRASTGRDGLGRGDAKLFGALGVWVGWQGLPPTLLVASLAGLAGALLLAWRSKEGLSGRFEIPFGPFLALGGWAVWLHGGLLFAPQ